MSETPEVDSEAMDGICCYGDPLKSLGYKRSKDGEVVPADFARRLERERDEARREINVLKRAAIEVLKAVPVAHCSEMYHGKRDMHFLGPCPVVERYNARIDKLRAILKEEAR